MSDKVPLILTAEQWDKQARMAEAYGKSPMLGASCEVCHLELTEKEVSPVADQCHCPGKEITLEEIVFAHGLEEYMDTFSMQYSEDDTDLG